MMIILSVLCASASLAGLVYGYRWYRAETQRVESQLARVASAFAYPQDSSVLTLRADASGVYRVADH